MAEQTGAESVSLLETGWKFPWGAPLADRTSPGHLQLGLRSFLVDDGHSGS